jgi:hypothetical protein
VEILRAVALGVLLGVIYVWPFAASRSYKRLIVSGVTTGRVVALLQKIVSLIVGISVLLLPSLLCVHFLARLLLGSILCCSLASQSRLVGLRGAIYSKSHVYNSTHTSTTT